VGKVTNRKDEAVTYRVNSIKELVTIVEFLDKYPLVTQKRSDFELFKQKFIVVKNKEHLNIEGLHKIISLKFNLNK
jgi:LAGLIDADG endonuclease